MTTETRSPSAVAPPASGQQPHRRSGVLGLVISREVRTRGRSKSFILSTLTSVALLLAVIVVPTLVGGGPASYDVGVVGEGNEGIVDAATRLADHDAPADASTAIEVTGLPDAAAAEEAVADGEVDAALVDESVLIVPRAGGFTSSDLADLLQQAAGAQQVIDIVGEADAARVDAAVSGDALEVTAVSGQDAAQTDGRTALAYGGVMLMYILIVQYGTWTLSGVTEEKANRVIEILLSTAPPWQLFAGKVIGIALLGLGQFLAILVASLTAIRVTGAFDLPVLPVGFAAVLGLWLLVGFAVYLVLFGCAGALAAKMEDAQSAMSPIMAILVAGFLASLNVLGNPEGFVAVAGTFVPFLAPFVVPIRAALETIPLWQHALSLIVSLVAAVGLTALSGRIYRGGALQFAGKVSWRHALRRSE